MEVFRGSATAIITPFKKEDESVDYDRFAALIEDQIEKKTDAIVVCGSTGESATMTEEEHVEVCRFCVERVNHRVPVIAGSGSNWTKTAIDLSRDMDRMGADAVLLVAPYYNKGTQEGVYAHFRKTAEAISISAILYNVPSRTGGNVEPATVARLVKDVPNITGIKEASGNIGQIVRIMELTDGNIDLYSGNDDQVVPLMSMGGIGVISVVANVLPGMMHDLCARFFEGDVAGSASLQRRIMPMFDQLFCEVNPIPVKKAMELMGFCDGTVRLPLTEMEPAHAAKLEQVMKEYGVL